MHEFKQLDPEFTNQVISTPGGEHALNCYQCGTCTAGCPVSEINNDYNPRRIMRMLLLGMKKEILSSPDIWLCSQCHTCVAHCPQDVRLADIIRVLRQMAVKEGYASDEMAQAHDELEAELKKERIDKIKKLTEKNQDLAELAQKSKDLAESSQKSRDLTESTQNNKDLTGGQL